MKKILIFGLLLGTGYYVYSKSKNPIASTNTHPGGLLPPDEDGFIKNVQTPYEGRVIVDKDGYWMLVKNGKLKTPTDLASLQKWQKENPTVADAVNVNTSVWLTYSEKHSEGSF